MEPAGESELRPRLARAPFVPLLLTPIRLGVAAGALVAASAVGIKGPGVGLAFIMGAFLTAFVLATDRRHVLFHRREELLPLPVDATFERWWQSAARGVIPSTVGVAVLAALALSFSTVLTAVLAGVEAGMGLTGLISAARLAAWERRLGGRLYVEPKTGATYVAGRADLSTAPFP
jgi:small-conductance mechanosensitive channel